MPGPRTSAICSACKSFAHSLSDLLQHLRVKRLGQKGADRPCGTEMIDGRLLTGFEIGRSNCWVTRMPPGPSAMTMDGIPKVSSI